ncbi:MAG: PAS domain S-box protein, partial [Alphaproteobacteria bacterium]|nr:PAS domain S-box protein [Alphaproteobacteria bacterium]
MVDIALHTDGRQKNPSVKAILKHAKVLKCLYDVSEVLYDYERPFSEVMQQVAALISEGFQDPPKAAVRIECCGFTYLTPHFKTSPWMISSEIDCHETVMGRIDVSYIEPLQNGKDRSFIPAEQTLLTEISKRISKNCFIRHEADILRIGASHLNMTFETAKIGLFHLDAAGRFLKVNPFFAIMLGRTVNQLLTMTLQDVLAGQNKGSEPPAISAFQNGQIKEYRERLQLLCADGSVLSGEMVLSLDQ